MKELIVHNIRSLRSKRVFSLAILVFLAGAMFLSGCAGQALVNFTYNATTGAGSGSVQITGAPQATSPSGGGGGGAAAGGATSQLVLFAVVVMLLIGVLAVVVASSRRRRIE